MWRMKHEEKPATDLTQNGGNTKKQEEMKHKDRRDSTTLEGDDDSEKEEVEEDPMEETAAFVKTVRDRPTTQHHYVAMPTHMDDGERGVRGHTRTHDG